MEKLKTKMIGLKLDIRTVERMEEIMGRLHIRSYNEVLRHCLFNEITIDGYYMYVYSNACSLNLPDFEKYRNLKSDNKNRSAYKDEYRYRKLDKK